MFEVRNITKSNEALQLQSFLFKTFHRRVGASTTISWLRPGVFRSDLWIIFSKKMRNTPENTKAQGISFLPIDPESLHRLLTGLNELCLNFESDDYKEKSNQVYKKFINCPKTTNDDRADFKWMKDMSIESVNAIMEIRDVVLRYNFELKKKKVA